MINVRGVNVYPSAIEAVVRKFSDVVEYRATVTTTRALRELSLEIELLPDRECARTVPEQLGAALRESLGLTVPLRVVEHGVLPRFEMKARRFLIE
jgi:phenylacetate-CoA ligase